MDHSYSVESALTLSNEWTPQHYIQLDDIILDFMAQQSIPGASLAFSLDNRLIYTQGYGIANPGQRVLSMSSFRLASISKPITAIAIMKLVETGRLQLDQKVFGLKGILPQYRPTCKGDKRILNITVRHLLQHSGGWDRDQVGDPVFWKLHKVTKDPHSNDALLRYMMSKKLQFKPGKRHAYSNLGYLILGTVIETVTGVCYIDFIQEICRPFNITAGCGKQSDCDVLEVKYFNNRENILEQSVLPGEGLVQTQYGALRMEGTESYGGLVMSAVELLQLFNQFGRCPDAILSNQHFDKMLQIPLYEHGQEWYGLGLDVQNNGDSWGHTGAMDGTSTTVHHHKSGLSWAVLFNSWSRDMDIDGLIKYGLSMVQGLPLSAGLNKSNRNVVKLENQIVHLMLPIEKLHFCIELYQGYFISHVDMLDLHGVLYVNVIWTKTTIKHEIFIEKNVKDLNLLIKRCNFSNAYVYLLDTHYFNDNIYYIIGIKDNLISVLQEINLNLDAKEHLELIKSMKNVGYAIKIQSVTGSGESLFVSAVYDKECKAKSISWLQITVENFIFELGKNSLKNLAPIYVKCMNFVGEPYVSAIWFPGENKEYFQRHDVSVYGFLYEILESNKTDLIIEKVCSYYNEGVVNFMALWSNE